MGRTILRGFAGALVASCLVASSGKAASLGGNLYFVEPCSSECGDTSAIAKIDLVGGENCAVTSAPGRLLPRIDQTQASSPAGRTRNPCYRQHLEFPIHPGRRVGFKNIPPGRYRVLLTRLGPTGSVARTKSANTSVARKTTNASVSGGGTTTLTTTSLDTVAFGLELTDSEGDDAWVQNTGQCYEVLVKDYGSETPLSRSLSVSLSASPGSFYSDSSCTTSTTSVTIAADSSSATAYFKSTSSGSATLTAETPITSADYAVVSADAIVTELAALAFSPSDLTQSVGTCGAVEVVTRNSSGQTVAVDSTLGTLKVSLSTGSTTGAFYSDDACTSETESVSISVGSSSATVYYKDTEAQDSTLLVAIGEFFDILTTFELMGEGTVTITSD